MSLSLSSLRIMVTIFAFNSVIDSKGPKFCDQKTFDTVFNGLKNQTFFMKQDWIWTYDQKYENMSAPVRQDPKEKTRLKDMAYISDVPHCSSNCTDSQTAKGLVIMFYRRPGYEFYGNYQVKRVINEVVTAIKDSESLPFGLRIKGNVFLPEERFWPQVITEKSQRLDRKHTIIVYNPRTYELIVVSKGQYKGWLCINKWTPYWKCQPIGNNWQFVGAFQFTDNIYVLAVKKSENRLFRVKTKDMKLIDTDISIQTYFGCGLKGKTFMADSPQEESEPQLKEKSNIVWVFVVLSTIVCLVIVFALISLLFANKRKSKPSKEGKDSNEGQNIKHKEKLKVKPNKAHHKATHKSSPKLRDDKGKEVSRSKVGALDSKVNWDVVLSTPSDAKDKKKKNKVHKNDKKIKI